MIRPQFDSDFISSRALLLITFGFMVATIWAPTFFRGYLSSWDSAGHLLKAHYWAHSLLANGHLSGWFPHWHGGFEEFYAYPPFVTVFMGLLTLAMPPEWALRFTMALAYLAMLPAGYYFNRAYINNRTAAAFGATLMVGLQSHFSVGATAIYVIGLIANGFGFVLTLLFLGKLQRILNEPDFTLASSLAAGLLLALLVHTHVYCSFWVLWGSLLMIGLHIFIGKSDAGLVLKKYTITGLTAALLSLHWLWPFALNVSNMGSPDTITKFTRGEVLSRLILSSIDLSWWVWLLALFGAATFTHKKKRQAFWYLFGMAGLSALFSLHKFLLMSQSIRFEGYLPWTLTVFASAAVLPFFDFFERRLAPGKASAAKLLFCLALMIPYQWSVASARQNWLRYPENEVTDSLPDLARELQGRLHPGEFVASEQSWATRNALGTPHLLTQRLPLLAPAVWDINGNFQEANETSHKSLPLAQNLGTWQYLEGFQAYLRERGVRYVITTVGETRALLAQAPWLTPLWAGPEVSDNGTATGFALFEINNYDTLLGMPPALTAEVEAVSYRAPGRFTVQFKRASTWLSELPLSISYHPWLRARVNGGPVEINKSELATVSIAPAEGVTVLEIACKTPVYAMIARVISLLTFLGALILIMGWQRRFIRPA